MPAIDSIGTRGVGSDFQQRGVSYNTLLRYMVQHKPCLGGLFSLDRAPSWGFTSPRDHCEIAEHQVLKMTGNVAEEFIPIKVYHVNGNCSSLRFICASDSLKTPRPRVLVLQPSGLPAMLSVAARSSVPWIWVGCSLFTS